MQPGQRLGQYELVCQTAEGGMASIWLARSAGPRGFQKVVAIKTMLPSVVDDPDAERMFLSEAAVASRIDHPNVVQTLDLCEEGGALYLIMEWVRGEPLSTVYSAAKAAGGMPLAIAARIVSQVAEGLHAAHELVDASGNCLGLVHRDVSPQNILVGFNGVVKVADFGIAKLTESKSSEDIEVGEIKGKVAYMAPEQIRLDPIDRRADVFAAGVILYLLTTGRHPFKRGDQQETALAILSDEPAASPQTVVANYPSRLERVVMRALAKNPGERYPTARELGVDLLRALPSSFKGAGHDEIRAYMKELLPQQFEKQQELMRVARDATGAGFTSAPVSVGHVLKASGRSSSTLRAVAVTTAEAESSVSPTVPPEATGDATPNRKRSPGRVALAATVGALFATLAVVALTRVVSRSAADHAGSARPTPAAVETSAPVGGPAERARELAPTPPAVSSLPSAAPPPAPPESSAEAVPAPAVPAPLQAPKAAAVRPKPRPVERRGADSRPRELELKDPY